LLFAAQVQIQTQTQTFSKKDYTQMCSHGQSNCRSTSNTSDIRDNSIATGNFDFTLLSSIWGLSSKRLSKSRPTDGTFLNHQWAC